MINLLLICVGIDRGKITDRWLCIITYILQFIM